MKAIGILLMLLGMATAVVVAAQPGSPTGLHVSLNAMEPAWMLLSGAMLLVIASVVRRYVP